MCSFGGGVSSCPLVQRSAGFRGFRTCHRSALVLLWCVPCLLSSPLLCLWCIALEYGSISRFKGVFRGFCGVGVYLCGFGALRGLWGFCARVELGGLKACGVFASVLSLLSSLLLLLSLFLPSLLVLLSSACPLACLVCSCVIVGFGFLFPFRYIRKKKGRNSLRPLLSCCGLVMGLLYA